jgi:hypothetical protein
LGALGRGRANAREDVSRGRVDEPFGETIERITEAIRRYRRQDQALTKQSRGAQRT